MRRPGHPQAGDCLLPGSGARHLEELLHNAPRLRADVRRGNAPRNRPRGRPRDGGGSRVGHRLRRPPRDGRRHPPLRRLLRGPPQGEEPRETRPRAAPRHRHRVRSHARPPDTM